MASAPTPTPTPGRQEFKFDKFIGLYTSVNAFSRAPQGAFKVLDNAVIYQPGLIEPRRGYSLLSTAATKTINSISSFLPKNQPTNTLSTIVGHSPGLGEFFSYQGGSFALGNISYGGNWFQGQIQPYFNARTRFVQYGYNLYATSSIGTWKSEDGLNWFHTYLPTTFASFAGVTGYAGSFGFSGTANNYSIINNWLAINYCCAYKLIIIRKNADNNAIVSGPPSDYFVVANTLGTSASVVLTIPNTILTKPTDVVQIYRTKSSPINA